LTKSIQFEIISRGSILQNYSHEPDIFSELQKCDNSKIKQFVNEYQNNGFNYKKDPNHIVTVIKEEFPETIEYYKIQLFLSQLYKDIADGISNEDRKRIYEFSSKKYLKKSKKTEKICVNTIHVSNQIEDIHENTDEKIIECENYYHKYEDPNFLLTKGNLESINNTEEAIKTFKEGTQKFEDDKRFNNNLANMYMSIEEFDTAKKYYTNIDKSSSSDNLQQEDIFWNNIGCMYSQINEIEKAEFYFNKAMRKNPKNFMVWYNGGIHKMLSGDTEGAEKNLEKSYKLNKNHHLTGINYAQALIKNGNKEKARGIVKKISPYQDQQTELFSDVRDSLENNDRDFSDRVENLRENIGKRKFVLKNNTLSEIKKDIQQEMDDTLVDLKNRDAQLFQRLVTAMQQHNTSTSKEISNDLAELRKKEKLMANNWEIILRLQFNPLEMKKLQDDNEKYLTLVRQIREIACIQKLMGEESTFELLVQLHNGIIEITENQSDHKFSNNLDSKELIKIANQKLKINEKDINALEMIIFAYFELNEMTEAIENIRKLNEIEPENEHFLGKMILDKKINFNKGFSNLLSHFGITKLEKNFSTLKGLREFEML